MSERKVLGKYYPPDFDPSALVRKRGPKQTGPKIQPVRLMAPFSMKCTTCGEFIYKGRKFNARKETPPDFVYLGVQRFRFYIKCTRCSAEIIFATDPASQDYVMVRGATRNQEVWRAKTAGDAAGETDEQRLDRLEREEAEAAEEQERNAMQELEAETVDAKREMAVADALDEIRTRNARIERAVGADGLDALVGRGPADDADDERARQEREDEEAARKAFAFARAQQALEEPMDVNENDGGANGAESSGSSSSSALAPAPAAVKPAPAAAVPAKEPAAPSFKRQVKKKKDHGALLGIKKKPALV